MMDPLYGNKRQPSLIPNLKISVLEIQGEQVCSDPLEMVVVIQYSVIVV